MWLRLWNSITTGSNEQDNTQRPTTGQHAKTHDRATRKDPRQGNAGDLGEWLSKPKNRAKMYHHDKEAAAELAAMREAEEATRPDNGKKN